jgi:hypothetical protein
MLGLPSPELECYDYEQRRGELVSAAAGAAAAAFALRAAGDGTDDDTCPSAAACPSAAGLDLNLHDAACRWFDQFSAARPYTRADADEVFEALMCVFLAFWLFGLMSGCGGQRGGEESAEAVYRDQSTPIHHKFSPSTSSP